MGTADPVRPAQRANGFVALDIVQQMLKVALCVRIVVASIESQQWAAIKDSNGKIFREVQR
jgi:hypothetical protein